VLEKQHEDDYEIQKNGSKYKLGSSINSDEEKKL